MAQKNNVQNKSFIEFKRFDDDFKKVFGSKKRPSTNLLAEKPNRDVSA